MRRLFAIRRDLAGNLPLLPAIFPDAMAAVIRLERDGERELSLMRWGFPPPLNLPVTNVRNTASPYWRGWLKAEWRCLVPATSFCEWTDSRPKHAAQDGQQIRKSNSKRATLPFSVKTAPCQPECFMACR